MFVLKSARRVAKSKRRNRGSFCTLTVYRQKNTADAAIVCSYGKKLGIAPLVELNGIRCVERLGKMKEKRPFMTEENICCVFFVSST